MLSETFIAASLAPPRLTSSTSALLKDAGVFVHSYQPHPKLQATFKRSVANSSGLAVSQTHIFVAQAGKATIHVYDRIKGSQEATISFRERITAISLLGSAFLAIGFSDGSIGIWEILTGRIVSTSQLHLQPVTALASDIDNTFLLSASADSTVLSWAVEDLLGLSNTALSDQAILKPRHALTTHRLEITALAVGHGSLGCNFCVSGSKDGTVVLWDYKAGGDPVKVYLLPDTPLALQFDPADRALFLSYSDGSVQCINILEASTGVWAPVQAPRTTIWKHPSASTVGPATALSISHDGTILLTGHSSGKICAWSVSEQCFMTEVAEYVGAPITNLSFLPSMSFSKSKAPSHSCFQVTKPRPHEPFSGSAGNTLLNESYSLHVKMSSMNSETMSSNPRVLRKRMCLNRSSSIATALGAIGFQPEVAQSALEDLFTAAGLAALTKGDGAAVDDDNDFMALDGSSDAATAANNGHDETTTNVNEKLLAELFALQRERQEWIQERAQLMQRRRRKQARRREAIDAHWHSKTGVPVNGVSGSILSKQDNQDGAGNRSWDEGSELSASTGEDDDEDEAD